MPYMPRSLSPTLGLQPEMQQQSKARKQAMPKHEDKEEKPISRLLGVGTLSLRKHEVNPRDVYKALFGKEPIVDEHSGELVHTSTPRTGGPGR